MILNVVLLIIGFFTCGKEFGLKTVYTSVMLPVFLGIFENIFPNTGSITNSQELDVLCYILVVSVGLSILFNRNASSGGLDIVAKIINKYFHMELGKAMSLSGMCVALSAALVYDKYSVYWELILMVLFWTILFLIIISNDGSVLLQKRKRNCGSLLFVICTVGQLFTKRLVLTIWKKEMRSLPL